MLISQISLDTHWDGTYNQSRQLTRQLVSNAKILMFGSPKALTRMNRAPTRKCRDIHLLPWRNPGVSCQNPWFFFRRMLLKRQSLDETSEI